jgi:hypothetical protein
MTSAPSSIVDLNQAIEKRNPFNRELIVRKEDIWEEGFPDYPSINSHASDVVFKAIEQVKSGKRKVVGITLKAEKGLGKTHIISRIRHQLKNEKNSLFVFMGEYSNLNNIKSEFLSTLSSSLRQVGRQDIRQWQELASSFANEALNKDFLPSKWVDIFPSALKKYPNIVELIVQKSLEKFSNIDDDPDLFRAIIWTLHSNYLSYATKWISGKPLSQKTADKMGLPADQKSLNPFERTCQLLALISKFYQVVICFDQLEGVEYNESGFTKAQVIANFAMDLYNSIQRGVILTAVYPDIWVHHIRALPTAEAVIDRIGEQTVDLRGLNGNDVVGLVSVWLRGFYSERELIPDSPVYPFQEEALRKLGEQRATARDVLQWCQKNWTVPSIEKDFGSQETQGFLDIFEAINSTFERILNGLENDEFIDEKEKLGKALIFGFQQLVGKTLDGFTIQEIDTEVIPKSANCGWIDFKVIGIEDGKKVQIGVAILQDSNGNGVQAGLKRLLDYKKFGLTRGCLIRSKKISPNARKAQEYLRQLLDEKAGEWVLLKAEEIKPLLAVLNIHDTREDEFDEKDVLKFIDDKNILSGNPLIREILSAPSGNLPEDAEDEEADLEQLNEINEAISLELEDAIQNGLNEEESFPDLSNPEVDLMLDYAETR